MYQKPQSYEVQFLRYRVRWTEFFVILGHFLPFYHPNNWENQNFLKMTEASGDIIILNMCIKNHNHTIWNTTDIIFCHLGPFSVLLPHYYLPFDLPNNPKKSKFWKNEKNTWRYYHFTLTYHKWWSYDAWFLGYAARQT